jgi:Outer membrane protein beta-barrel domain
MKTLAQRCVALITLVMTIALSAQAHAKLNADETWYVGGGAGLAKINNLCKAGSRYGCDDQAGSFRLFGGMKFNKYFALEATLDIGGDFLAPGSTAAGYDGGVAASFFGLNAIGSIPMGERVSLYGGVSGVFSYVLTDVTETRYHSGTYTSCYYDGYNYYDGWYSYCTSRSYDRDYRSDSSVSGGALLGIDIKVAKHIHVRAQAQRYFDVSGDLAFGGSRDVDNFTLNALFSFR